ncbi:MAG TPA: glycosyltransferase family 4 protein, partial [Propionibacteriaceae bacterium]|nr:glycosyltransferase family 4 protein [Propionibacteriaceae bacterium]
VIITNDFPPRIGGIESFVADIAELLDRKVLVYASGPPGASRTDADRGYPVVRAGELLLPTPRVAARAVDLIRQSGATSVIFGAAAPLGLLAPTLRRAGVQHIIGITHGHETWWARLPGARSLLRRIGDGCDHLTAISAYTERRIGYALSPEGRSRLVRLPPPVDSGFFQPAPIADRPDRARCVAVGRFVAQKGFTTLLRAWRLVLADPALRNDRPELVLVGDGPQRRRLQTMINRDGMAGTVRFTGALPRAGVRTELQRAQVFALPVRTRLAGLNPEGLGLAALEAAACGLPVIIGGSGGAPETVRDGRSGFVIPPDDHRMLADRLVLLLTDPDCSRAMGADGRAYVQQHFSPDRARATLRGVLAPPAGRPE